MTLHFSCLQVPSSFGIFFTAVCFAFRHLEAVLFLAQTILLWAHHNRGECEIFCCLSGHWALALSEGNCGVNHHITPLRVTQLKGILVIGKDQRYSKAALKVDTLLKRLGIKKNWIRYYREEKTLNIYQILWTVSKMIKHFVYLLIQRDHFQSAPLWVLKLVSVKNWFILPWTFLSNWDNVL